MGWILVSGTAASDRMKYSGYSIGSRWISAKTVKYLSFIPILNLKRKVSSLIKLNINISYDGIVKNVL